MSQKPFFDKEFFKGWAVATLGPALILGQLFLQARYVPIGWWTFPLLFLSTLFGHYAWSGLEHWFEGKAPLNIKAQDIEESPELIEALRLIDQWKENSK